MKDIMARMNRRNQYREIITICGFVPWHQKYTTHLGKSSHDPVPSEWRVVELASAYNAILDADAAGYCGLANASAYCQFSLADHYEANRPAKFPAYDPKKTYVLIYLGDYGMDTGREKESGIEIAGTGIAAHKIIVGRLFPLNIIKNLRIPVG